MTWLAGSNRLQNAIKCCIKVRKTGATGQSRIILPSFNVESPHFTWTSRSTLSSARPDMTPPATSGRHFWKFKKRPKISTSTALGRTLVTQRFACYTWSASCLMRDNYSDILPDEMNCDATMWRPTLQYNSEWNGLCNSGKEEETTCIIVQLSLI